jgi:hypothetical protein
VSNWFDLPVPIPQIISTIGPLLQNTKLVEENLIMDFVMLTFTSRVPKLGSRVEIEGCAFLGCCLPISRIQTHVACASASASAEASTETTAWRSTGHASRIDNASLRTDTGLLKQDIAVV